MMAKARQSDSSLPAAAERIGGEEGFTLERADRYATMRSVDSNKVRIHFQESDKDVQIEGKDSKDSPKNPFTAEPAGESRETYDIGPVTGKGRKLPAGIDGEMQAIRPVEVLHQGRRLSVGHSQSLPFSSYQLQGRTMTAIWCLLLLQPLQTNGLSGPPSLPVCVERENDRGYESVPAEENVTGLARKSNPVHQFRMPAQLGANGPSFLVAALLVDGRQNDARGSV
ncbi:hypothetical protein WR25_12183, partial [Diploscapter pachys]